MPEPIPVIKYSFDSCTPGRTAVTVTNEGSYVGMDGTFVKSTRGSMRYFNQLTVLLEQII